MTGRQVVLVVDAHQQHFGPGAGLFDRDSVVTQAASVVAAARAAGVHVLHTHLQFRADGLDGGHYFRRNPDLAAFAGQQFEPVLQLRPTADELVVSRSYPSAFFGTSLPATVRGIEADAVILVGASTSGAIRAAAIDALQHGFTPIVVGDAVADITESINADSLRDLRDHYADVVAADDVIALLQAATSR